MSKKSIRDRHLSAISDTSTQPSRQTAPDNDLRPYEAFGGLPATEDRDDYGIMLHYGDGAREVVFHGYIMRAVGTDDTHVNLITTEGVYIIEGRHIGSLLDAIQTRKAHSIQAFNPDKHAQPADDAPFISSIEFYFHEDWWAFLRARDEVRPPEDPAESA